MFRIEKIKLTPSDKLTIDGITKSVLQWVKHDPHIIQNFIRQNREEYALSAHLQLELKATLNEQNKRSNSKRGS